MEENFQMAVSASPGRLGDFPDCGMSFEFVACDSPILANAALLLRRFTPDWMMPARNRLEF